MNTGKSFENLYAGQEATVRTGHGTTDWFQIGKRVQQGCILSPCLFNLYAEYIMRNAGLEETQAGNKIAGRGAVLKWQRNRTERPLSPPQIYQKNISTLIKFHKTTSECW